MHEMLVSRGHIQIENAYRVECKFRIPRFDVQYVGVDDDHVPFENFYFFRVVDKVSRALRDEHDFREFVRVKTYRIRHFQIFFEIIVLRAYVN